MNEPFRDATHDDMEVLANLLQHTRGLSLVAGNAMELGFVDADDEV